MNSGERHLWSSVPPCSRPRGSWRTACLLVLLPFITQLCLAQSSDTTDSLRGVVINSVTHEPVSRALVYSPDQRFATMTNSEGRFEFTFPSPEPYAGDQSNTLQAGGGRIQAGIPARPYALVARKPGFLNDQSAPPRNLQNAGGSDLTLTLIPEAVIAGTVALPTSEPPDSVTVQIFRRQVQDGRAHWVPAGGARSLSDGQFRFSDLPAGTYRLLTQELLDRDPFIPRGELFGYPPVYFPGAPDFDSSGIIQVAAGQTAQVNLSLTKQRYYRVRIPVVNGGQDGFVVNVYANGTRGPGFSLGYNGASHSVEGMLPNGTYTIEASSFGPNGLSGTQTIVVKDAPADGPRLVVAPSASISVNVKEEFTQADAIGSVTWNINGRNTVLRGPRRYLNVMLEPADDFGMGRGVSLRNPTGPGDDSLVLEPVPAGSYWVRVNSSRGYAASIRSGNLDLERQPLVIGTGGAISPIEITMRDDTASIGGTVEGVAPPQPAIGAGDGSVGATFSFAPQAGAHVYCMPLPESPGQFTEIWVNPDGSFSSPGIPPGAYRLLAFDRPQPNLEYRNPEVMEAYDTRGPIVRLSPGQQEYIQLPLISTRE